MQNITADFLGTFWNVCLKNLRNKNTHSKLYIASGLKSPENGCFLSKTTVFSYSEDQVMQLISAGQSIRYLARCKQKYRIQFRLAEIERDIDFLSNYRYNIPKWRNMPSPFTGRVCYSLRFQKRVQGILSSEEQTLYHNGAAEYLTIYACVQIMHLGVFDDAPATVTRMEEYLADTLAKGNF